MQQYAPAGDLRARIRGQIALGAGASTMVGGHVVTMNPLGALNPAVTEFIASQMGSASPPEVLSYAQALHNDGFRSIDDMRTLSMEELAAYVPLKMHARKLFAALKLVRCCCACDHWVAPHFNIVACVVVCVCGGGGRTTLCQRLLSRRLRRLAATSVRPAARSSPREPRTWSPASSVGSARLAHHRARKETEWGALLCLALCTL